MSLTGFAYMPAEDYQAICDAVREKTGETALLKSPEVGPKIENLTVLRETVQTYSQMNERVRAYLEEADSAYTEDNGDTVSVMEQFQTAENDMDRPLGFPVGQTRGKLYIQNESSGIGCALPVVEGSTDQIWNGIPGEVCRYQILDEEGNMLENGRICPSGRVRMIRFMGYIRNCRDLGGWECDGGTVRYGMLFRSGAPASQETWIDPKMAKALEIRHHVDLRGTNETEDTASCLGKQVRYVRLPLNLYYKNIIDVEGSDYTNVKAVMRTIIDGVIHGEPVLYNCSLGRDRTGTVSFMLLALLGVSGADIDKDYELSSFSPENQPAVRTRSDYQAMRTYLAGLGGQTLRDQVVRWFLEAGFSLEELNEFRGAMCTGTPETLVPEDSAVYYRISLDLSGCSGSNDAVQVIAGGSYSNTLSFTGGNNEFVFFQVMMGGADISESAFQNGVITVDSVTGDLEITVSAGFVAAYTNLLPLATDTDGSIFNTVGYMTGARLSSSGGISAANGMDATGFIPVAWGDMVSLRGIHFNKTSGNYSQHRIAFYDSSRTFFAMAQGNHATGDPETALMGMYVDGELLAFQVQNWEENDLRNAAYFRICGDTFDSGAVITVNEEIP